VISLFAAPRRLACNGRLLRTVLVAISLAASLGGCGWRLQGREHLPAVMTRAYVDSADRYSAFDRALRESLRASGATLVGDRRDASAVVRIRKDDTGRRVLSVSARNTPEEYEVYYRIEYSVEAGGKELIATQELELTQDYSYNQTAVLAKQREEETLRQALARDLANQLLRRLAAL
jgi:LPS-assembly lipoprotein